MEVLVRDDDTEEWAFTYFSHYSNKEDGFCTNGLIWEQCIPLEGNEYLLGNTNLCKKEYINWEE